MTAAQLALFAPAPARGVSPWRERRYIVRGNQLPRHPNDNPWVVCVGDARGVRDFGAIRSRTFAEALLLAADLASWRGTPCTRFLVRHRCWPPPGPERVRLMDAATSVRTFGGQA